MWKLVVHIQIVQITYYEIFVLPLESFYTYMIAPINYITIVAHVGSNSSVGMLPTFSISVLS